MMKIICIIFSILTLVWSQVLWAQSQTTSNASNSFNYLSVTNGALIDAATNAVDNSLNGNVINNPFQGENNLYSQIFDALNSEYVHIGNLQAQKVLNNNLSVTGGLNSIGFSYQRPFIDFHIALDRSLAPDLFSATRWVVTDSLTISIDASKILNRLKNNNSIDINEQNLALFAGIIFQRKFTWIHYADNYNDGLMGHFEKLFFPFKAMELGTLQNLDLNDIITKEDSISINAGGFVSAPLYTSGIGNISGIAGVLAKFQRISKLSLTREDSITSGNDFILLSFEKSKVENAGLSLAIQADFLKILKMTLLSYEVTYELNQSYTVYTKFNGSEIREMNASNEVAGEINKLLAGNQVDVNILAPYVISQENNTSELVAHKYNFLLLGGTKSAKTQQIDVTTAGITKTFFRHYYEKIKYTESLLSRLFASVIFAITNSDLKASNVATDTKRVTIEYDSLKNLIDTHDDLNIGTNVDSQKLTLTFQGDYNTQKTTGFFGGKYKDRALFILENYSGVDPLALDMINRDYLVAPFDIQGQYQVNTAGIRYFNQLSVANVFDVFDGVCTDKPKTSWFNFRTLFDTCRITLQNNYFDYLTDLTHSKVTNDLISQCEKKSWKYIFNAGKKRAFIKNCLSSLTYKDEANWVQIPLWSLKNLTQNIVNNNDSKIYYYNMFGVENVFFYGSFTANTSNGSPFATYFHEGAFKGLGAVDHYMRLENLRSPASVVVDQ